ncbi:hypothetical protein [Saccharothrix longispora]|uniref:hypothetical protein n=1 Tax=Saccharothrix longispora TaxID=33920 RepID=UPI0028FD810F|nr:hypothetical protein [Saccharothrix longispora]MBY8848816.1 hypothetical protein [Saccharothrix sp. MB29]MDU0290516.1 hypothetical protein [Saccharothrix longispora]
MTALVRYLLADVLRTQRWLPPLLLFAAVLGMLYASDAGPPLPAYAGTCVLVYPVSAWLTVVIATAEDPVRRSVTVVAAGGWGRVQAAVAVLASLAAVVLAAVAALVPVLTQPRPYPPATVLEGFAALAVCALVGVGVGVLCGRPVITRVGWSVLASAALVVLVLLFGRTPPVGNVLWSLSHQDGVTGALALSGALAVLFVVAATRLGTALGPRRG